MLNPSYLIKSRHDIYYFRYPLPIEPCGKSNRVSISLKTRCPREALQLAKVLEYHSLNLIAGINIERMDYTEIVSILKEHYSEVLERSKARINTKGRLPDRSIEVIAEELKIIDEVIDDGSDDLAEMLDTEYENSEHSLGHKLKKIMGEHELNFKKDSDDYKNLKAAYKFVRRNYLRDVLTYNNQVVDFSFLGKPQGSVTKHINPEYKLGNIIETYLNELKPNMDDRTYSTKVSYLNHLIDWLGEDFLIAKVGHTEVQEIKNSLIGTPLNRNKGNTGELRLREQIAYAKEHKLDTLSGVTVNNYLDVFSSLFKWIERNKFIEENPFDGIRVPVNKKGKKRDLFSDDEISQIIDNLGDGTPNKRVKHTTYYWGALIAVYTGARRNEIASLLPSDIKQDAKTGIWYFDITDEEDSKNIKTESARRIVPIHSKLIELNFLEYVDHARDFIKDHPKIKTKTGEYDTRLLYDLTYEDNDKWGRKLGRWFNENYLKKIKLKEDKKSLHSLRHSLITSLSAEEVEHATIRAIVGHEASTVTEKNYIHYDTRHLPAFQKAIEKLSY